MNKRFFLLLLVSLSGSHFIFAQYYYKDIVSNKQTIAERKLLKEKKIHHIQVHSLEPDGSESPGFFCEKKISKDYSKIETYAKSNVTGRSILTTYYNEAGLLIKSIDSSEISVSYSIYKYNENGNLISIANNSHSFDDDFATTLTEERVYTYNEKGHPDKLFLIKNNKDTTEFSFSIDENGNVTDEIEKLKPSNHYYYYYNPDNKLSDIVRFNVIKAKLTPDFIFEYNDAGQIDQMVNTEAGPTSDYFTWKYFYNDAGFRIIEKCFSKEKELMGSFEYEYE
jgi:hypothetical protein